MQPEQAMLLSRVSGVLRCALAGAAACFVPFFQQPAQAETGTATAQSLEIRLELRSSAPPAGAVVLHNAGASELCVWRMANSWGDETLSFELNADGKTQSIKLKPQYYTLNGPIYVPLAPGQDYRIEFNLGNLRRWEPDLWHDHPPAAGSELTAVYHSERSPESDKYSVWTGSLRSAPVKLK